MNFMEAAKNLLIGYEEKGEIIDPGIIKIKNETINGIRKK